MRKDDIEQMVRDAHEFIHEVLVDLLYMQRELHPGVFAVMDGTVEQPGGVALQTRTTTTKKKGMSSFALVGIIAVAVILRRLHEADARIGDGGEALA